MNDSHDADEVLPASSALANWAQQDPTGFRQWLISQYPEKLTTSDHAALAAAAVDAHRLLTGRDPLSAGGQSSEYEGSLTDLLADLMHYARLHGGHFGRALDSARQTYVRECASETAERRQERLTGLRQDIPASSRPAWLAACDTPQTIKDGLSARSPVPPPQRNTRPPQHHRPGQPPRRRYGA